MYRVQCTPTPDAWIAFLRYVIASEPEMARADRRLMAVVWVRAALTLPIFLACFWILLRRLEPDMARFGLVLGFIVWALYAMFITQTTRQHGTSGALARLLSKARSRVNAASFSVLVNEHGVTLTQPDMTWTQAWSRFARIVDIPECVVIEHADFDHSVVIPRAALTPGPDGDDFAREAQRLHEASGHGELSRLRAGIDSSGYECSACGYPLKGCPGVVCPECNRRVTIGALRAASVLNVPFFKLLIRPGQRSG